ncbi:hypothetical protein FPQ18DRAFT_49284, partial [Pyronema domesticum]
LCSSLWIHRFSCSRVRILFLANIRLNCFLSYSLPSIRLNCLLSHSILSPTSRSILHLHHIRTPHPFFSTNSTSAPMAKPDSPLRQISQSCLHGLIILFCCPITCILLTFAPRCRTASHTARRHRHARRNTHMHSCILVSPAGNPSYIDLPPPPEFDDNRNIYGRRDRGGQGVEEWDPEMAHLTNQGNRIFAIRPTDGILSSGNVAAGARGFKMAGKELVGLLGKQVETDAGNDDEGER